MRETFKFILLPLLVSSIGLAHGGNRQDQFLSRVQLAVYETSPKLIKRSHKLALDYFAGAFKARPELQGKRYEVRVIGNQLVFSLVTEKDFRNPLQQVVASMIRHLNGKVRARGRSLFYRTPFSERSSGRLEVIVDEDHNGILFISVQSVPLWGLLKELRSKLRNFSYLISGECAAQRRLDWSFGDPALETAKPIQAAMRELAMVFDLKHENGTYIFAPQGGLCQPSQSRPTQFAPPIPYQTRRANTHFVSSIPVQPRIAFPIVPIAAD